MPSLRNYLFYKVCLVVVSVFLDNGLFSASVISIFFNYYGLMITVAIPVMITNCYANGACANPDIFRRGRYSSAIQACGGYGCQDKSLNHSTSPISGL